MKYLNEIIGFFVVEDRIMQTEPSLVTPAHKDQLWEMTMQQVITTMNGHFVRRSLLCTACSLIPV